MINKIDTRQFQREIYEDLDQKLRASPWKSGASEAHGLLTGLACRGIMTVEIANKMHLLQLTSDEDRGMIEGLYELILQDLKSSEPTFNLLLPEQHIPVSARADEIANWCGGYIQGFCHDGESTITESDIDIREMLQDIMDISGMQINTAEIVQHDEEEERDLMEIEEYLRVGVQLVFDQIVGSNDINRTNQNRVNDTSDQIH